MYHIKRAGEDAVIEQNEYIMEVGGEKISIEYLTFPKLDPSGVVKHLFTTRTGGVSEGFLGSMNLNFNRGDAPENVVENYSRIGRILGISVDQMVLSMQTHTTNIRRVYKEDGGRGITRQLGYEDVDGLITNDAGIALVTSYADCVPLYFVDATHRAIGLAHSGWKGTAGRIAMCMVKRMCSEFGTDPKQLQVAIGPSICRDCYEVSKDVADVFIEMFKDDDALATEIERSGYRSGYDRKNVLVVETGKTEGKYKLDLWLANMLILMEAGVPLANISVTDICTCHNPEYLFSHRASKGKRGNLSAFLMLKDC